jgi:alanine dehydrogenase
MIRLFGADDVRRAVSPLEAYDAVREAFVAYARGEWTMPPKVYVANYPAGDFRAMPALGGGHALLKWVTSFPANPARGLPTVTGLVVLSDADDGRLLAVLDAATVTALRTAAAAVIAADVLARSDAETFAVVGAGVNGAETARMFAARGRALMVFDLDQARARTVADEIGAGVAARAEDALSGDVVATVTPGAGKAEVAMEELARARLFVDDWGQASHGGETAAAVEASLLTRDDVTELGAVLTGDAAGRQHPDDVTLFDSTGLAIQDLAIAKAAYAKANELELQTIEL